jgi:hypothetical protein
MANPLPPQDSHLIKALEAKHCRAICGVIGKELRYRLARDTSPVPTRLRKLVDRLAELEGDAPPISPGCEDKPAAWKRAKRGLRFWWFHRGA